MRITKIEPQTVFKNETQGRNAQRPEFIDKFSDAIKNPRDVNDCVAVPRGIFKAYLLIMGGTGLIAIANLLSSRMKGTKRFLSIAGWVMNILSAWFFAKGFALKGLNPTVNRDEFKKN